MKHQHAPTLPTLSRSLRRVAVQLAMLSSAIVLAGCDNREANAAGARAAEINALRHQSFADVAEPGRCAPSCKDQETGFDFAKTRLISNPDLCPTRYGADFLEGCRQYGETVEAADTKALEGDK